jgi:hypothetical protein
MTTESRILEIARSIRADAWAEHNGSEIRVGFAINRAEGASEYNAAAAQVADALRLDGFKVRVRTGDGDWMFTMIVVRA